MRLLACYLSLITVFAVVGLAQDSRPIMQKLSGDTRPKRLDVSQGLIEGKVIRVLDGDTLNIQTRENAVHTIRIQGIDAPDEKQDNAKKSRKNLEELILDKDVKVVAHKSDQRGYVIGSVYLLGRDIGLFQIESGMAWHFKQYSYEQTAANRKTYALAETKAKADRLGLWEKGDAVPPWELRGEKPPEARNVKAAATTPPAASANTGERKYTLGPRGGCYYVSSSGRKVYVDDKSLCTPEQTGLKKP